jgi:hypothetical protein
MLIVFNLPTIFITNLTVSGGDANDFSSVNCPFSIFSSANLAASSTGSALALEERKLGLRFDD